MTKTALGALLVLSIAMPGTAQDPKKNDDVAADEDQGYMMRRPPKPAKGEQLWKCSTDAKWFKDTKVSVTHIMDDVLVDVGVQFPESGKNWAELKAIVKSIIENYKENLKPKDGADKAAWKDFTNKVDDKAKFPGAGGCNAHHIEGKITDANDSKREVREWVFFKNDVLYRFVVVCGPGKFAEKAKDLNFIMASFSCWKPKRK